MCEDNKMKHLVFGNGPKDLVIIPGLSFKPICDSPQAVIDAYSFFTRDYTVWLFDRKTYCPKGYSIRDMAEDTVAEMKTLGIGKADIFGASQGGMIAQYIAIDHPETVNKMVLASTACRNSDHSLNVFGKWNDLASEGRVGDLVSLCVDTMYSPATLRKYRDVIVGNNDDISDDDLARFVIMTRSIIDFDSSAELKNIVCPVLVIGCEGDKVFGPEPSCEISNIIGAELYVYGSEFGHCVYDEAPDYKDRLSAFFGK